VSGSEYYSPMCLYIASGAPRAFLVRARQRRHAKEKRMPSMFTGVSHASKTFREPLLVYQRTYILNSIILKIQLPLLSAHRAAPDFVWRLDLRRWAAKGYAVDDQPRTKVPYIC
jgi:hypothetical protein